MLQLPVESRADMLQMQLMEKGIGTAIHFPIPIYLQKAYADLNIPQGTYPISEQTADQILSLPIYPELKNEEISCIVQSVNDVISTF